MRDSDDVAALQVFVNGEAWTRIPSLANAGPEDKVFALDQDGLLRFGDGVHGKIPPAGSKITASYRFDGGSAGNIAIEVSGNWPLQKSAYLLSLSDRGVPIRHLRSAGEQYSGEKRLDFFSGQILTATDFEAEQNYFLRKSRRHNRMLHGWGVVSGLEVTVTGGPDSSVVISPGYAIDAEGRENPSLRPDFAVPSRCSLSPIGGAAVCGKRDGL